MKKVLFKLNFVLTRLWRFQSLYFLKPHDAINDTLTASILSRLDWSGSTLELGSGDGVFSYIMHGGRFPLWYDRYLLTDLAKTDIYDSHKSGVINTLVEIAEPRINLAIDAKFSHVEKIKEIGFAQQYAVAAYEELPVASQSIEKIFYYTPHGLRNHDEAIDEAVRVLQPGGKMLILLFQSAVSSSFLCYRLGRRFSGSIGQYFARLDNGRFEEITNLAKTRAEWEDYFESKGLTIEARNSGLSTFAWKMYDIQTRPILKFLIRCFGLLPLRSRTLVKTVWMILWYPYLVIFYALFSNRLISISSKDCYLAYQLEKV